MRIFQKDRSETAEELETTDESKTVDEESETEEVDCGGEEVFMFVRQLTWQLEVGQNRLSFQCCIKINGHS